MKYSHPFLIATILSLFTCCGQTENVKVGETLPLWQEGELDIHFISTGHGDCTFQIFPDGTTFLVDAAGAVTKERKHIGVAEWKPNDIATPGQTIVNYINHFSPSKSVGHINYFLLTHHHGDHMGELKSDTPLHDSGAFKLTSLCEIGSLLVMDNIYDRDWPDFSFPKEATGEMMSNYKDFLKWTEQRNGSNIEKWAVGRDTQVVPLHNKPYDFTIRNLAGNGCCATGGEGECVSYMPSKSEFDVMEKEAFPNENCFSCGYILSYGKFDFFNGGDLQFSDSTDSSETIAYPYMDAESPLTNVIHKVEVMVADHHGVRGANSADLVNKLAPNIWLVGVWTNIRQPDPEPTSRVLAANQNCEIFCTYQSPDNIERLGEENVSHITSRYGHVVVRVAQGGDSYMVYTLEDSDEEYKVKSIHGPYACGD